MASLLEQAAKNPFDNWRSITVSLYMTLVGYGMLVGVPVISTAWVTLLGFTEEQVGRVVSADLGGLTAGAILTSLFVRRSNRRLIALIGLIFAIIANGGCLFSREYMPVLLLRIGAGFGGGIYTAIAVATLGGSSRPARSYGLMMLAFAFSQAAEMHILPQLSVNGIYLLFMGCFLFTVPWIRWMPAHPPKELPYAAKELPKNYPDELHNQVVSDTHRQKPVVDGLTPLRRRNRLNALLPWFCLIAIFFTYVNIGAYWTYIELSALRAGIAESWIVPLLTWVSLGSLVGCVAAMLISDRFGLSKPLLYSLAGMVVIVGILGVKINHNTLLISLLFFNWLWIFIDVYQMSTAAVIDRTGTFASLLPASQGLGQIVGPNLAASMLGAGMVYERIFLMCAGMVMVGLLFYLWMYLSLRRKIPELSRHSA